MPATEPLEAHVQGLASEEQRRTWVAQLGAAAGRGDAAAVGALLQSPSARAHLDDCEARV